MPKYESKCPKHTELDIYSGCSFDCIYCISHSEHKNHTFDLKQELEKIENTNGLAKPYYLSPWTDAYQHIEEEKQHSKQIIKALVNKNRAFFVITKSTLAKRDIEFFKNRQNVFIAISLNTLDDNITKVFEPGAPSATERRQLIEELAADKSVNLVVKIDPIIPGITDGQELNNLLEWLCTIKPTAITADTLRLSNLIVLEINKHIDNELTNNILKYYPKVNNQPIHPNIDYRMRVLRKVSEQLKRAGVKASFCQASLPLKLTEFDCRGGYNYDY